MEEETEFNEILERVSFYYYKQQGRDMTDVRGSARVDAIEIAKEFLFHNFDLEMEDAEEMAKDFVSDSFSSVWSEYAQNGFSLWVEIDRGETDRETTFETEYPIFTVCPAGIWMSAKRRMGGLDRISVSDDFLIACAQIPKDSENTNGWSNCSNEVYDGMSETERKIWTSFREVFILSTPMSDEQRLLIEKGGKIIEDNNEDNV